MTRLSDIILAKLGKTPRKGSTIDRLRAEQGVVGKSAEWQRIAGLPRRVINFAAVPDLTPLYQIFDHGCLGCDLCHSGEARLRAIQSAMLFEAEQSNGLFAAVGVGHGKELTCLLLPDALHSEHAVIITKPRLRDQMLNVDIPRYGRHFRLPLDRITVMTYAELSDPYTDENPLDELHKQRPIDAIICNEAHCLRHFRSSARGRKFRDWRDKHREVRYCFLTGTPGPSILHYAHLCEWALDVGSPLPQSYRELEDWSRALDVPKEDAEKYPIAPGAILKLCGDEVRAQLAAELEIEQSDSIVPDFAFKRRVARRVFQVRLAETSGVVMSGNAEDADCSLVMAARKPQIPQVIREHLEKLRLTWSLGEEDLFEAAMVADKARQLDCGFYYYWDWPGGVPDTEWVEARSAWGKVVREVMKRHKEMYSPLIVFNAAGRGELRPEQQQIWETWCDVKDRWKPEPPRGVRWLSDFLLDDVEAWAAECTDEQPGVIWYKYDEIGERLRQRGLEVYASGEEGDAILTSTSKVVVASMGHRDGKNLQRFSRAYVLTWPSNATDSQQLLGRHHRPGQQADEVTFDVAAHDEALVEAVEKAIVEARVIEDTQKEKQKILYATKLNF